MASDIDICNTALGWLGANLILTLDDTSTEGRLCKAQYPLLRDAVLENRAWTFATRVFQPPVAIAVDYPPNLQVAYAVPNDCLRMVTMFLPGSTFIEIQPGQDNTVNVYSMRLGSFIYTNTVGAWMKYIQRVEDTSKFSSGFVQALAARLAMDLAMPITNNVNLMTRMVALFDAKMKEASAAEGQQGTSQRITARTLARSRY